MRYLSYHSDIYGGPYEGYGRPGFITQLGEWGMPGAAMQTLPPEGEISSLGALLEAPAAAPLLLAAGAALVGLPALKQKGRKGQDKRILALGMAAMAAFLHMRLY